MFIGIVVVPGYYLVWYNLVSVISPGSEVVVPGYYLVWYNMALMLVRAR